MKPRTDKEKKELLAIHRAVFKAFKGADGRVLKEFLRTHCYMVPSPKPHKWEKAEQLVYRASRTDLFLMLEYFADPLNFQFQEKKS